jgi:hypothetical protein
VIRRSDGVLEESAGGHARISCSSLSHLAIGVLVNRDTAKPKANEHSHFHEVLAL